MKNEEIIILFKEIIDYMRDKDIIITSQDYTIKNLNERINHAMLELETEILHCNSALSNKEKNIVSKHELLELQKEALEKIKSILEGE